MINAIKDAISRTKVFIIAWSAIIFLFEICVVVIAFKRGILEEVLSYVFISGPLYWVGGVHMIVIIRWILDSLSED